MGKMINITLKRLRGIIKEEISGVMRESRSNLKRSLLADVLASSDAETVLEELVEALEDGVAINILQSMLDGPPASWDGY